MARCADCGTGLGTADKLVSALYRHEGRWVCRGCRGTARRGER